MLPMNDADLSVCEFLLSALSCHYCSTALTVLLPLRFCEAARRGGSGADSTCAAPLAAAPLAAAAAQSHAVSTHYTLDVGHMSRNQSARSHDKAEAERKARRSTAM